MTTSSYGKNFVGPMHMQRLATLPTWTSDDVGRVVYAIDVGKMYIGGNVDWIEGGGGSGAGYYLHTQAVSATSWSVAHNLGQKYVEVQVIGTDDYQMEPLNVEYVDLNNLIIYFSVSTPGYAVVTGGTSGTSGSSGSSGTSGDSGTSGTSGASETAIAVSIVVFDGNTNCAISDGVEGFVIPYQLNGYNLIDALGSVSTSGATNTMDIQIRRKRSGTDNDMLSTKITIADAEYYARDGVIDTNYDDVATGDLLFIDVDAIHATPAKGLSVALTFELP